MPDQYLFWEQWEERLQHWKLQHTAASLLEHGAVLNVLFAQILHMAQPLLNPERSQELDSLAELLESPQHCQAFANRLREEPRS